MTRKKTNHFVILASLTLVHAILIGGIAGELKHLVQGISPASFARLFKDIIYFIAYSFFPGIGCLVVISLVKTRVWAHIATIFYVLTYFSFVLFLMIYKNYSGVFPPLNTIANPQEVTSIIGQIVIQFMGIKEWVVLALMALTLYACWQSVRDNNPPFQWKSKKTIGWLAFFFLLNMKGPLQITINNKWPQNTGDGKLKLHNAMLNNINEQIFRQGFHSYYLWNYLYRLNFPLDKHSIRYLGSINQTESLSNTILQRGYNIVSIQVESLAAQVIDMKTPSGEEITPFLNRLKKNSLYFENFYAQHGGGHSADAELALFLSMVPLDTHLGLTTVGHNHVKKNSLLKFLRNNGYDIAVMHNHDGRFFNRADNYTRLGIEKFWHAKHYEGPSGLYSSRDDKFLMQSLPKMDSLKRPFFAHLITLQSHGPFKNYHKETLKNIDLSAFTGIKRDYLASIHEVDQAFRGFFEAMEAKGILQDTIVFLYSDHQPNIDFERQCPDECIPLFIHAPGIIKPKVKKTLATHLDLAPTILHVLGIIPTAAPQWLGSNLFDRFPERQVALLPHHKVLVRDKGGVVKKIPSVNSDFLQFYQYRRKVLENR